PLARPHLLPLFPTRLLPILVDATPPRAVPSLSLHDALPILAMLRERFHEYRAPFMSNSIEILGSVLGFESVAIGGVALALESMSDRKSTRLNSSHVKISYAVCCLKKKRKDELTRYDRNGTDV